MIDRDALQQIFNGQLFPDRFKDYASNGLQVERRSDIGKLVATDDKPVRRIGWCTGGAQGYFEAAIAAGVDAYITCEILEAQAYDVRKCGAAYLACGHRATERYGVQAAAQNVAAQCGLEHVCIDIDNPA